jgi:hypothetical protein
MPKKRTSSILLYIIICLEFFMKKKEIKINFHSGKVDLNTILQRIVSTKLEEHFDMSMGENLGKIKRKAVKQL